MVDVVCPKHLARELLKEIILLVRSMVRPDDAELALAAAHFLKFLRYCFERLRPGRRLQFAVLAHEWRLQAVRVMREIERVAAFDAKEFAVDAGVVAVVAADDLIVANSQSRLATVRAVCADGADVLHLPGAGFVAIRAAGERAHWADIDAHAALVAIEVIEAVGLDLAVDAAIVDAQRANAHSLIADSNAAVAQDAAGLVIEHDRRPLFLVDVELLLEKAPLAAAVAERHVLQLALAALVEDRTIPP